MTEKIIATAVIGIVSTLMIFVRRYKNDDKNAGYGIAGWTIFIMVMMWT